MDRGLLPSAIRAIIPRARQQPLALSDSPALRLTGVCCRCAAQRRRHSDGKQPDAWAAAHPLGTTSGVYVALSPDEGSSWQLRFLPVGLPHEVDVLEHATNFSTLGYSTVRQAPYGQIHVLSTMTHPCLHYEFNEAWVLANSTCLSGGRSCDALGGRDMVEGGRGGEDSIGSTPRVSKSHREIFKELRSEGTLRAT